MDKDVILHYVELALTNLNCNKQMKFNIEGEVARVMNLYSEEQIKEIIEKTSFNLKL